MSQFCSMLSLYCTCSMQVILVSLKCWLLTILLPQWVILQKYRVIYRFSFFWIRKFFCFGFKLRLLGLQVICALSFSRIYPMAQSQISGLWVMILLSFSIALVPLFLSHILRYDFNCICNLLCLVILSRMLCLWNGSSQASF